MKIIEDENRIVVDGRNMNRRLGRRGYGGRKRGYDIEERLKLRGGGGTGCSH
jgi:hypothetical protein